MTEGKRIVVGITGASGAVYAQRLIGLLVEAGVEVHLIVSLLGQRLLHDELGMEGINLDALAKGPTWVADSAANKACSSKAITLHPYRDLGSFLASGSFKHDAMVVVPCSSNTLSAVAHGSSQNLLHRAAAVALKERRRLVLLHREMPLTIVDIRNMELATQAGAIVCPASPGFYTLPQTVGDLVDFVVGRILDLIDIEHGLDVRWDPEKVKRGKAGVEASGPASSA